MSTRTARPSRVPLWIPENHPEAVVALQQRLMAVQLPPPVVVAAPPPPPAAAAAPFVVVNSAKEALAAWDAGQTPFFSRAIAIELDLPVTAVLSTTGNAGNPAREVLCEECGCPMRNHSHDGVPKQFHEVNVVFVPNGSGVYEAPRPGAKKNLFCRPKRSHEPGPVKPWTTQALWRFLSIPSATSFPPTL